MTDRLILSVAAAQFELETVATLMSSIGQVVAQERQNDWWRGHDAGELAEYERQLRRQRIEAEQMRQFMARPIPNIDLGRLIVGRVDG